MMERGRAASPFVLSLSKDLVCEAGSFLPPMLRQAQHERSGCGKNRRGHHTVRPEPVEGQASKRQVSSRRHPELVSGSLSTARLPNEVLKQVQDDEQPPSPFVLSLSKDRAPTALEYLFPLRRDHREQFRPGQRLAIPGKGVISRLLVDKHLPTQAQPGILVGRVVEQPGADHMLA